jgi:hypothetical protein
MTTLRIPCLIQNFPNSVYVPTPRIPRPAARGARPYNIASVGRKPRRGVPPDEAFDCHHQRQHSMHPRRRNRADRHLSLYTECLLAHGNGGNPVSVDLIINSHAFYRTCHHQRQHSMHPRRRNRADRHLSLYTECLPAHGNGGNPVSVDLIINSHAFGGTTFGVPPYRTWMRRIKARCYGYSSYSAISALIESPNLGVNTDAQTASQGRCLCVRYAGRWAPQEP